MSTSDLFANLGVDIAAIINAEMGPMMPDAVLTKRTPGTRGADVTAGNNETSVDYPCKGMRAGQTTRMDGSLIRKKVPTVTLLGDSLPPGIVPEPGDQVTIEGATYFITSVVADEAQATYLLETPSK